MAKYIIGVIVLILVAAGGYYMWSTKDATPIEETPPIVVPTTNTYATSTFSITYPKEFTIDTKYQYKGVPNKPIDGVSFTIPLTMATGTNLSADSRVSVEWLPRASICAGDIYILDNVRAREMTEGGVKYSVATSSGAGAGNFYEEAVYAFPGSSPCTAVRYFIHSTNLANYATGTVRAFDRAGLIRQFDTIRSSHKFTTTVVSTTTSQGF